MTKDSKRPTEEDYAPKHTEYEERHKFWTGQTIVQFGNANNYFIIVALAMLGYFLKEFSRRAEIELCIFGKNLPTTLLLIPALLALASLLCGTLALLSRLYDFRLNRHLMTIRKKAYSLEYGYKLFNDEYIDPRNNYSYLKYVLHLLANFVKTMTTRKYFIKYNELSNNGIFERFHKLRAQTLKLSRFSWVCFGWQIIWLSFSVIYYCLILLAQKP